MSFVILSDSSKLSTVLSNLINSQIKLHVVLFPAHTEILPKTMVTLYLEILLLPVCPFFSVILNVFVVILCVHLVISFCCHYASQHVCMHHPWPTLITCPCPNTSITSVTPPSALPFNPHKEVPLQTDKSKFTSYFQESGEDVEGP